MLNRLDKIDTMLVIMGILQFDKNESFVIKAIS